MAGLSSVIFRSIPTVFRLSYNRNYQTPPNENLLLSNSDESTVLVPAHVRAVLGSGLLRASALREPDIESSAGPPSCDLRFRRRLRQSSRRPQTLGFAISSFEPDQ